MGQSYLLGCPEGGERALQQAVASVDREMCSIRDSGKVRARERIAVLAALNLAFALAERPPMAVSGQGAVNPQAGGDVATLIARIDEVLGVDGQLL